ncbi:MAG: transcription antitermination factor NusB [Gemmataceae bacterium]|nr:transcription antitermination factor NusB [Gemmataceae bacterium]
MTRRSRAREVALQLLFQKDQNPKAISRAAIERFARDRLRTDRGAAEFCLAIYDAVILHREEIDKLISTTAENWKIHRMLPVDRNLLRIGTYEMRFAAEPLPPAIAIDEVIELARRFGSADSPGFVNGVLDRIAKSAAPVGP